MSGPTDGLTPEFDPRRGQPPRPPRGGDPRGRSPRGQDPRGGYPGGSGGSPGGDRGDGGSAGYRGGDSGGDGGYRAGRGQDARGGYRGGGALPPELDPRGAYRPDGLAGYDVPAPDRASGRATRQRRHSPLVAALRVSAAFLSVLVLLASGVMWFLYRDFTTKVDRVNAIGATHDDVDGRDTNILLVGSDDRTNATPAELKELSTTEEVTNSTDTMILVHIPADGRKATAVSFPRDSWVTIPGCSGQHKLNSAYINGATDCGTTKADPDRGRQKLVQTISQLSGLKIDHYVEVDLLGFYRITKAIGGVQICLNQAQKDPFSGIDLPKGPSTIEGKQALAFVRQRHGLPRGDLDRIVRQQYFMSATFRKVTSLGVLTNPIKLKRLLDAVGSSMLMDSGLDPIQLAGQLRGLAAGNVTFTTIPTEGNGVRNGQDVILVDESAIPQFFESVINPPKPKTAAKPAARGDVTVTIYNGSGRSGLAAQAASGLTKAGFKVGGTGNADRQDYSRTEIRYGSGGEAGARAVLAVIPSATLVPRDGVSGVQLVLGSDFRSIGAAASKAPTASSSPKAPGDSRTAADTSCIN
ncbi:MAG TPA: LCP family protein [Mycobacteriales bacterium]|nr:LCP family protein [Mycobacteriales bacterium]